MEEKIFWQINKNYRRALKKLRKKFENGVKIRVGFAVVFDSVFPMASVFENMLKDEFFDPFLIVIPDISRGEKHALETFVQTKVKLTAYYGNEATIINPIDWSRKACLDITGKCDLYCTANPYDTMTHPLYGIRNFCEHAIPVFFANYGIAISSFYDRYMKDPESFGLFWRVFCETEHVYDLLKSNIPWVDAVYSGYPKMDKLASFAPRKKERKSIIIAPHHTITKWKDGVNFSNFLQYKNFFLDLPNIYPNIDFIFRPHPLLFTALARNENFGERKAEIYLSQMRSYKNVDVQMGGDYLETFINSDALIHDCGSFTAEYLFTGKPVCRILRNKDDLKKEYNQFALECIACHDIAYTNEDIIRFIDNVVLNGNDTKSCLRNKMSLKLKKNFPYVSNAIINNIKEAIKNA